MNSSELVLATNNGDIGGGEVMLFNIARAARSLGHAVTIIAPSQPNEVVKASQDEGFSTVILPSTNRKQYIAQLRLWSATQRRGRLLWCNGLVPSFATAGQKNRIVHLHQIPEGTHRFVARLARHKARALLAPSDFAAQKLAGFQTFHNWVHPVERNVLQPLSNRPVRVGFLGRPSDFKGTQYLAQAIDILNTGTPAGYQLVLGGESRFVEESDTQELKASLDNLGKALEKMGWVTPEEFFSHIDMLVVPSNWDEVFGLVAAESMSAKTPLIVSDAGALPEVVGETYPFIVARADPQSLAQIIAAVAEEITQDSPLLENMINLAYNRWHERFSPAAGKQRVASLLEQLQ
ncbi:glycosyltransferase family 4 protein [Rothia sp. ZJ1223]|uniref:glycosyltransferase family 4 protein n=1 Tax=Rothia sp. ZJ1223 TaxID=2811098 RepID=UPI001959E38F|nr:glycosyltransferase family 4 protein [Rothia sp. ZJ1223]MBM7051403.1 glycosyltransferase family 4 protein [Rothia sp. ZJ1223]